MLIDIALLVVAYAIAVIIPTWRWWLVYALVPVIGFGLIAWALAGGSHASWLMLLALAAPVFAGAAGGLIVRAILLWRPQEGTTRWVILAVGLMLTIAAAVWVL